MRILLTTGSDKVDAFIKKTEERFEYSSVSSRANILAKNKEYRYDIIFLSNYLPGKEDICEIIFELQRETDCRIIYLPGDCKPAIILDAFAFGVRDFITDPIDPKLLLESITKPATYGMAATKIKSITSQPESVKKLTSYFKKNVPDAPLEVTPEARSILAGLLLLLKQPEGKTIEESLLNLEEGLSKIII